MPDIRTGKILYARNIPHKDGGVHPPRRVIVIKPNHTKGVAECVVAATLRRPEHDDRCEVLLPHGSNGQPHTQTTFDRPTVAVCGWIEHVPHEDLQQTDGHVKPHIMSEILQKVNLMSKQKRDGK